MEQTPIDPGPSLSHLPLHFFHVLTDWFPVEGRSKGERARGEGGGEKRPLQSVPIHPNPFHIDINQFFHRFQLPFDERSLCRLFLSAAGGNYDAYDKPELSPSTPPEVEAIVSALLEIDARKRPTPHEFYEMAVDWSSRHVRAGEESS